jgi:hypothetical protein
MNFSGTPNKFKEEFIVYQFNVYGKGTIFRFYKVNGEYVNELLIKPQQAQPREKGVTYEDDDENEQPYYGYGPEI